MKPRETRSAAVLRLLREEIVSCHIPPGTPIRDKDLAAKLGVSRTPVREALRQLQADGLVTVWPRSLTAASLIRHEVVADS